MTDLEFIKMVKNGKGTVEQKIIMRGGKRKGAGRKKTGLTEIVYIRISKMAKSKLERECNEKNISKSQYVNLAILHE